MKEVHHTVPGQPGDGEPQAMFEADHCEGREDGHHHGFEDKRARRAAHHREQDVVQRDDDEDGPAEAAVAVEARPPREHRDEQGEADTDEVAHCSRSQVCVRPKSEKPMNPRTFSLRPSSSRRSLHR